ncbi:acetylcholine receptor subunit alpha-1-A-like [Babylonia areolata]|uniref:acetylcholine receptor subunit alpha-1-A-like n=1 Tax=Babylonia areolata TaxID=304850 RepID=UPI003FD1E3C5
MRAALVVVLVVLTTDTCLSQSALNVSKLYDDLPKLNSQIRPVKDLTQPTAVNISFHLLSIISLDTVIQKLVSNGWLSVAWQNDYLTWEPADYEGVRKFSHFGDQTWKPRLTMSNTMKKLQPFGEENSMLEFYDSGLVRWFPGDQFETFCHIDVTYFPFDFHRCTWQLFSWGDDATEVVLQPDSPHIDLDTYLSCSEWQLMSTRAWKTDISSNSANLSALNYEVTLRRRPTLLALTVLMPVFVLSVTSVFVFTIPSEAGERLSYAVTSFLSLAVFMSFIVDLMPSSTETLSIMAVSISCQLILSAVFVLFCILSLRLFHRDPHKHPVPPTLQTLIVGLELLLCLDPPSQPRHTVHTEVEMISSDCPSGHNEIEVKSSQLEVHLARWARQKKVRKEAYTQPQDMTWQRVSRSLDQLLFRFFFCLVIASNIMVISILAFHYNDSA